MNRLQILQRIREQQENSNQQYFSKGIFPSYRTNTVLNIKHPDDNIFFSASVLYILKSHSRFLTIKELDIINEIEFTLAPNFKNYIDKKDRNSYNFWQKKANKHFPYGYLLHHFNKFKLPDDVDTTSMIHMVSDYNKHEANKTKEFLPLYANKYKNTIGNGHHQLRDLKAYSTWFGEKMPIEFDICVLSNVMLWNHHYEFENTTNDNDTLKLIGETIKYSLYFKSAFKSSPEYPKIEIILYHLARLLAQTNILQEYRSKLITDIENIIIKVKNPFAQMLLESSLIKLGVKLKHTNPNNLTIEPQKYWWFTAGFLSVYSNALIQKIAPMSFVHFRFSCPAFNLALIFENCVLHDAFQSKN